MFDQEIEALGAKIYYIKYSFRHCFHFRKQFQSVLRKERYDAIHDHQDFISGWHYLLGLGQLPAKRVSHLHNPYNFVRNYVSSPVRWISYKIGRILNVIHATKITGTSDAVMDEYGYNKWPYKMKRAKPVYCGFDVSEFKFKETAKQTIYREFDWDLLRSKTALFIGRLDTDARSEIRNQKNPEFALLIAKRLVAQNDHWKFIFVGQKGLIGEHMEADVINRGLGNSIKFLGIRRDIPILLSAADVLIFPSLWEGLGMVAVEAQASGLPVILSSTVPGEAIVCQDLVNVKELNDGVEVWLNAVIEASQHPREKRSSFANYVSASPFSIENSVSNLYKLYS